MNKILVSAGVAVFMGAVAVGATGAFFSDSETSSGNIFTAGALDLKVDSQSHYDGLICVPNIGDAPTGFHWAQDPAIGPNPTVRPDLLNKPCDGTWAMTDLGPTNHFFNISDIKPGDSGEDTISLHVDNNAWACLDLRTTSNNDNTVLQPEINAGDNASSTAGELAQNTHFQAWLDQGATPGFQNSTTTPNADPTEGDNIWQQGEPALASGTLNDIVNGTTTITLADGGTGTPLDPAFTNYIGLFWCAGTVTGGAGNLGCDGTTLGNIVQTDSATADITLRVVQSRNNPSFRCTPPTTGGITVIKQIVNNTTNQQLGGLTPASFSIHVLNSVPADVAGSPQAGSAVGTTYNGLTPGAYSVSETPSVATGLVDTLSFSGACNGNANITVTAGNTATCTITNTITGTLVQ